MAATARVVGEACTSEDRSEGSVWWFEHEVGLNSFGLIPGDTLQDQHVSKAEYNQFWGAKNYHNGARYKRNVSPKMVWRIRNHYQKVFQRPIGQKDEFPWQFGRALLAERNGWPINWAAYARKMTHRGTGDKQHLGPRKQGRIRNRRCRKQTEMRKEGFKFQSMTSKLARLSRVQWPANWVGPEPENLEGRDDDWEINVRVLPDPEDEGNIVANPQYCMPPPKLRPFVSSRPIVRGGRKPTTHPPWLVGTSFVGTRII